MPNPYNNKIQLADGTVLIDLSSDTLSSADQLMQGVVAHDRTGAVITGTGGTPAIAVTEEPDTGGGVIKNITALDISDTTAVAEDVAQGKYFYTAGGIKTAGTASGGGGGLEYEEGTWTPNTDTTNPVFTFQNAHSEPPVFATIYTEGVTTIDMTWLCVTVYKYWMIDTYVHQTQSVTAYGTHEMTRRTSRGGYATARSTVDQANEFDNYMTNESFMPQGSYGSDYGYWRSGLTYKWIAVWAPTT